MSHGCASGHKDQFFGFCLPQKHNLSPGVLKLEKCMNRLVGNIICLQTQRGILGKSIVSLGSHSKRIVDLLFLTNTQIIYGSYENLGLKKMHKHFDGWLPWGRFWLAKPQNGIIWYSFPTKLKGGYFVCVCHLLLLAIYTTSLCKTSSFQPASSNCPKPRARDGKFDPRTDQRLFRAATATCSWLMKAKVVTPNFSKHVGAQSSKEPAKWHHYLPPQKNVIRSRSIPSRF